jgi:hypothetical protein
MVGVFMRACGQYLFIALIATSPAVCQAASLNLFTTLDELVTSQGKWRAELGGAYANTDGFFTRPGQPITIQTGSTQFLTFVPVGGIERINTDTLVLTPGLHYGLTSRTELYGRASWLSSTTRTTVAPSGSVSEGTVNRFADAWIGVNHVLLREDKYPAVLGFAELALAENGSVSGTANDYGKSLLLGGTVYRTTDPLVLTLTGAYRHNLERNLDGGSYDPGNVVLANPSVHFAVNDDVTLVGGVQWRWQAETQVNDVRYAAETRTDQNLGMGYKWDKRLTLSASVRNNISGLGGADLSLTAVYKLDDEPRRMDAPVASLSDKPLIPMAAYSMPEPAKVATSPVQAKTLSDTHLKLASALQVKPVSLAALDKELGGISLRVADIGETRGHKHKKAGARLAFKDREIRQAELTTTSQIM